MEILKWNFRRSTMANDSINLNIEMGGNAKQYLEVVSEETFELANTYVGKSIKNARS